MKSHNYTRTILAFTIICLFATSLTLAFVSNAKAASEAQYKLILEESDPFLLDTDSAHEKRPNDPIANSGYSTPTVQFSSENFFVNEGSGLAVITVTLSPEPVFTYTVVTVTLSAGTATPDEDYQGMQFFALFSGSETESVFHIEIYDDSIYEGNETIFLTLDSAINADLGSPMTATLTIIDNDDPPLIQFSQTEFSTTESIEIVSITTTLSNLSALTTTVSYATNNGTAIAPNDYLATSGLLTFAPNQASQIISITIIDDVLDEIDETFTVELFDPTNASLGTPFTTVVTIIDNDGPEIIFNPLTYHTTEDDGSVLVNVELNVPSVQNITVDYVTQDESAIAGSDYLATNGTLLFMAGELTKTIHVAIIDDNTLFEPDETFQVVLSNPVNATLGNTMMATVVIEDNDNVNAPPVAVNAPSNPSEPVTVSVNTPAGVVVIVLENVTGSGFLTTHVSITPPNPTPSNFTILNANFEITTSGIDFSGAIVSFPYLHDDVTIANVPEGSLRLLHFEDGKWQDITTNLDTTVNVITGFTERFSVFALGVQNMQSCTISLNNGAIYTGKLENQVFSNTPTVSEMLVSNDAGFGGAQWQPYHSALTWVITDPGDRIVTLLVYARFRDENGLVLCNGLSLSDDIIYDPLAPTINSVTIQSDLQDIFGMRFQYNNTISLQLSAVDQQGGSGVADMQISTNANFHGAQWQPFSTTAQIIAQPNDKLYVRVRDGVGNISETVIVNVSGNNYIFLPLIVR